MRDALSLADQAIAFGSGQLQEATVRLMLGSVDRSHVMGLIDALARGDGATVVAISEGLRLNGLSAASALEDMSMVLQRMAVLQAVPSAAAESDDPDHQEMLRLSEAMPAMKRSCSTACVCTAVQNWAWRPMSTLRSPWSC